MLQAENISWYIGAMPIVDKVSFEALQGEILVMLGANGAGKSTLLNIVTGQLKPATGKVSIQGKLLQQWRNDQRAQFSAVLQQHSNLSLPFTVSEVVMMGRYPHFKKQPSGLDKTIVRSALKKAGIDQLSDRNYLSLSGGEKQRVHLARVFAQIWFAANFETRYLFMDEPSNNLDIRHQHASLQMAREFAAEGNCVIAILHDLNLALQYADKILMLKQGEVIGFGKPADILCEKRISKLYDIPLQVYHHPGYAHPIVMPANQSKNQFINK